MDGRASSRVGPREQSPWRLRFPPPDCVRRPRVVPSRIHGVGRARVERAPRSLELRRLPLPTPPLGPRARVERAYRGPQPRVLPLNDRGHQCANGAEIREAAGAIRTPKGSLTGRVPNPVPASAATPPQVAARKRGEPRLPQHLVVRHVWWRRSRRAVWGSVGLTCDSSGGRV